MKHTPGCVPAYIGIGANLGDSRQAVVRAAAEVARLAGIHRSDLSPLYRSAPVDSSGPDYVNAVLRVETTLAPETLLQALQTIENEHGRERPYRNAPRTLDLDLLLHGSATRDTDFLVLPHPRMHLRAFVLRPLQDLEPDMILSQGDLGTLLRECADQRLERLPEPL